LTCENYWCHVRALKTFFAHAAFRLSYWYTMTFESFHLAATCRLNFRTSIECFCFSIDLAWIIAIVESRHWCPFHSSDKYKSSHTARDIDCSFNNANVDYIIHWPVIILIDNQIGGNSRREFSKKIPRRSIERSSRSTFSSMISRLRCLLAIFKHRYRDTSLLTLINP